MKIYYYDVRSVGIDEDVSRYWGYKVMNSIEGIEVVGDVSECDYVVMRKTYTSNYHDLNKRVCEELNQYSGRYGKQFVYFLHDDPVDDMGDCVDGGIIFRTSYNRSEGRINEYCMPSFFPEDLKMVGMDIIGGGISVGFCGAITNVIRMDACNALMGVGGIDVNIKVREMFHDGYSIKNKVINRSEFLDIMYSNVYQLCCRGAGNFSHRFYETLASGRIPVLVDTDIPLPDIGEDWSNYIVMSSDVEQLPVKLMEWHINHDVVEMQVRCRRLWEERLTFKGFGGIVGNILLNNLKKN